MTRPVFIRAEPMPGESIYGYLTRLGPIMGYDSHKWVFDAFSDLFQNRTIRCLLTTQNLAFLAESLGLSQQRLDTLRFPLGDRELSCRDQKISRRDVSVDSLYFCPLCVRDHGTHMLMWQFNFLVTCPIHKVSMVSRCIRCDAALNLGAVKRGRCDHCSDSIDATHPSDSTLHEAVDLLLSLMGGLAGADQRRALPPILNDADFTLALKLILAVGRLQEPVQIRGVASMRKGMDFRLSRGFEMFKNWERSAQWLIARAARNVNGKLTFIGYKDIFCRQTNDKIRKQAEAEISKFLSQRGETTEEDIRRGELVRMDYAAQRVGLTKVTLKKIGERRRDTGTREKWNKATYLHNGEVRWLQRCMNECVSSKEACHSLGISDRRQVQALYDNHIFPHADPALVLDHRSRCFRRQPINDLCQEIGKLPERDADSTCEMTWRTAKAVYMSRHHASIDFYRAVIQKELIPIGRQTGVMGLPGLIFRRDRILAISNGDLVGTYAISRPARPSGPKSSPH